MTAAADNTTSWETVRHNLNRVAAERGEWGGVPIPVDHVRLIMEPRFPMKGLHHAKLGETESSEPLPEIINSWFCFERGSVVYIIRENGKSVKVLLPEGPGLRFRFWVNTFAVAAQHAWSSDVELRAMEKLKSHLTPHAYNCYVMTGSFLETSKRSNVTYLFRKLRPTVAMRPDADNDMKVIAILCLHPLGYYDQTWAGVMAPSDDVCAHVLMMRHCEEKFWAKANHHSMWMASAGI